MNKDQKIKQLVARFMEGETSLDEEKQLYRYFNSQHVAAELQPLQEMFCSIATLSPTEEEKVSPRPLVRKLFNRKTFAGIAASAAILLTVGSMLWHASRQNYCEAYIYNRHVTDPALVMEQVDGTLQELHQDNAANVENQLQDIFRQE